MNTHTDFYQDKLSLSMSYSQYMELIPALLTQQKTTGDNHSESMLDYTRLNLQRMQRLDKTTKLYEETLNGLTTLKHSRQLLVLTEAWCGDAAQIIPVLDKIVGASPLLSLQLILRDEHLDLMDQHLTNGGRAIPKLALLDENNQLLASWGPRPKAAQQMVIDYKALGDDKPPYSEFVKKVQLWYARDKTRAIQQEITDFLVQND